jgi:F-type H+-transporting ATPase subunit gamma
VASTRQLKSRIRSVRSTKQITKAMEMVAASKMRRAQEADKAAVNYTETASELLSYFTKQGITKKHPLFQVREVNRRLLIVVASDRGLAGAYNSNVFKRYVQELKNDRADGDTTPTIALGRKTAQFVSRLKEAELVSVYENVSDNLDGGEMQAILDMARDQFVAGEVDAVDVIFTQFISSVTQQVTTKRILPAGFEEVAVTDDVSEAVYEPSPAKVLDAVAFRLVQAQLYQALLDAKASEHSMRMLAMKNASDNAEDLVDDLTLAMNKARQGAITQELAEISGGVEAMNE